MATSPNKYPARCVGCGETVAAQKGALSKNQFDEWQVRCMDCYKKQYSKRIAIDLVEDRVRFRPKDRLGMYIGLYKALTVLGQWHKRDNGTYATVHDARVIVAALLEEDFDLEINPTVTSLLEST